MFAIRVGSLSVAYLLLRLFAIILNLQKAKPSCAKTWVLKTVQQAWLFSSGDAVVAIGVSFGV